MVSLGFTVLYFFILHIIIALMSTNLKKISKAAPVHKRKHISYGLDVKIDTTSK
jgi:hypothetical protein